ncbi:MAG: SGNH/GDSL hydrolase family protein [Acidimicrobiia bacterium]
MTRALRTVAAVALLAAACSPGSDGPAPGAGLPPVVDGARSTLYVAVGASETAGLRAEVPLRDGWPRVLYQTAMPPATVFVNLGIPGATVAQALAVELPQALGLEPDLVTVWLNVNDILAGVAAADFERDLGTLVRGLRRGGATRVLVANTPPLDRLPAYLACRPDPPATAPECRRPEPLPEPDVVNAMVDDYNAATARIAGEQGAQLVDLHAVGMAAREAGIDQALVSFDGFHPNSGGHQAVATAFAKVLTANGGRR